MPKPEYRSYDVWFNHDGSVDIMTARPQRDCHLRRHVSLITVKRLVTLLNHALLYSQNYATVWERGWFVTVRSPDHA